MPQEKSKPWLWHLTQQWRGLFDHEHWWPDIKHDDDPTPPYLRMAAVWEIYRRQPRTEKLLSARSKPKNAREFFLTEHGLKCWTTFNRLQRIEWQDALREMKPQSGIEFRPVVSISLQSVDLDSGAPPNAALTLDPSLPVKGKRNAEIRSLLDLAVREREEAIAKFAIEHHRAGRIILAVHPDSANFEKTAELIAKSLRASGKKIKGGKGRVQDRLKNIRKFEETQLASDPEWDSQLFACYKRALSQIVF